MIIKVSTQSLCKKTRAEKTVTNSCPFWFCSLFLRIFDFDSGYKTCVTEVFYYTNIFLLVYDLLLRKETFFNYNRAYLLSTSIISLVLPFIRFPKLREVTTKDLVIQLPEVFIGEPLITQQDIVVVEQSGIILEQLSIPLWQIIAIVGIGIATLIFISKILKIRYLLVNI